MVESSADQFVTSEQDALLVVTCPKGLELLLVDELTQLGAQNVRPSVAHVTCEADQNLAYKICLWSRLASRVLWPLGEVPAKTANQLYQGLMGISWIEHFSDRNSFRVTFNGMNDEIRHTHFGALKVKDAICDHFRDKTGQRPDVSDQPDISIHVRLHRDMAKVSLDLAGEALHRRGYRQSQGAAPLKENLAAAVLIRAGWPERMKEVDGALIDPMCGSGTLLIEAALMAADIAPGLLRKRFGFDRWKQHDLKAWREILQDAQDKKAAAAESEAELTMLGYDADEKVLNKARDNARRAGVQHFIFVEKQPLTNLKKAKGLPDKGLILTNPPYGERLSDEVAVGALYASLGNKVKEHFGGWTLGVFTGNPEQAYQFKMRADKQYALFNGAIASKLMMYSVSQQENRAEPVKAQSDSEPMRADQLSNGAQMVCNRLQKNQRKLKPWLKKQKTDCYRLYDADMPEYAVAIDLYGDWVHIQEYAPPKSVDAEKANARLRDVLDAVPVALNVAREKIILKQRQVQKGKRQYEKQNEQAQSFEVTEGNCRFYVNLTDYLDTGLFLDHRPVRTEIETLSKNKDFLNLFSYTCTASVHAAVGGARSTTSVDMSQTYLNWGKRNLALNGVSDSHHEFVQADCIKWLEEQQSNKQRYDVIFMDPPSFSNSKRMLDVLDVQRDHVKLVSLAMGLLRPGGQLIFSNNLRKFKLDYDGLSDFQVEDITVQTLPQDFARNTKIHQCFRITAS